MKPLICRVGSKRGIADKLISLIPEHITYVEPFVGGGAVLFKKEPSEREVINDLDDELIKTYRIAKRIKTFNFREDINTLDKVKEFFLQPIKTDEDYLTYQKIKYCNSFGSVGAKQTYDLFKPSNPYASLKDIQKYKTRLENVKIHNLSYEKVIKKYDSKNTFFYLDPPYMSSSRLYNGHGNFDYNKLLNVLINIKGKFMLSINDDINLRELFKQFHIKSLFVSSKSGTDKITIGGQHRNEMIITNYKIE